MSFLSGQRHGQELAPRKTESLSSLFARMESIARGLAATLGIALVFESAGGESIELASDWEGPLEAALLHAVRNSLDHGGQGKGKNDQLVLRLTARREPDYVSIECSDTGAGIDPERVREAAQAAGCASEMGRWTTKRCCSLLFFTRPELEQGVSQLSGRGYGLNIVREAIESSFQGSAYRIAPRAGGRG